MALSIGIENLGNQENPDLEKEKRAYLAFGIAEALFRHSKRHLIDIDQYSVAMFGADIDTGLEEENENIQTLNSFVSAITNKDSAGQDIIFTSSKSANADPLAGKVSSFSSEAFIPVKFEVLPGRETLSVENWYGRLLVAVETDDATVQVPFLSTHSLISPYTKADPRKKSPDPRKLHVVSYDVPYSRVEFGNEVYGRDLSK